LTGQGRYVDDVNAPRQAHVACAVAARAADLVAIDAAPAQGDGVLAVFRTRPNDGGTPRR
jgi:hypothetical protein